MSSQPNPKPDPPSLTAAMRARHAVLPQLSDAERVARRRKTAKSLTGSTLLEQMTRATASPGTFGPSLAPSSLEVLTKQLNRTAPRVVLPPVATSGFDTITKQLMSGTGPLASLTRASDALAGPSSLARALETAAKFSASPTLDRGLFDSPTVPLRPPVVPEVRVVEADTTLLDELRRNADAAHEMLALLRRQDERDARAEARALAADEREQRAEAREDRMLTLTASALRWGKISGVVAVIAVVVAVVLGS